VITPANDPALLPIVRELFVEYAQSLGIDLSFQRFDEEIASLPGDYDVPRGGLYLVYVERAYAGCIAFRPFDDESASRGGRSICEMKRLYVRPGFRGHDLGRRLAVRTIQDARATGYTHMRLDTLPSMGAAIRLYESLGFVDIAPYRENPIEGTRYLELDLVTAVPSPLPRVVPVFCPKCSTAVDVPLFPATATVLCPACHVSWTTPTHRSRY
jgi:ribosomal protein S18 acetylase RimI-like enzyme